LCNKNFPHGGGTPKNFFIVSATAGEHPKTFLPLPPPRGNKEKHFYCFPHRGGIPKNFFIAFAVAGEPMGALRPPWLCRAPTKKSRNFFLLFFVLLL
jgi:hypothetical protein